MNVILTLDYELYFGKNVGSAQACLVDASNKLISILDKYEAKAVFFIDASYLYRLNVLSVGSPSLKSEYELVVNHIKELEESGHQIQLHIHPHWFDTTYNKGWNLATKRYRLVDWPKDMAAQIINHSVEELNSHLKKNVFAFRAGGWCIQPFTHIADALFNRGVFLDSTVFHKGRSLSSSHNYDFTSSPNKSFWKFGDDPCLEDKNGRFTEIPIAAQRLSPIFYWKFAFMKFFGDKKMHQAFGDGQAIKNSKKDVYRMMTRYSNSVVSIDGYKSTFLKQSYKKAVKRGDNNFVVIGHPKALSLFSLKNIDEWLSYIYSQNNKLTLYKMSNS
jgi:hypothetical protein